MCNQDGHSKLTIDVIPEYIRVSVDDHILPHFLVFSWEIPGAWLRPEDSNINHMNWQCFDYITNWLKAADVEFTVDGFELTRCSIYVHCATSSRQIKLMFGDMDRQYLEDGMA